MEGTGLVDDQRIGSKRGRDDEKDNNGVGRLEKRPSGIVLTEEYSYSGDEMINGVKYEEEKETTATPSSSSPAAVPAPAGLFNQLISNLVSSPRSNETHHQLQSEKKIDDGAAAAAEGRGEGDDAEQVAGGGNEKDGDATSSGNLVDDIVAQLPRTLSEDTAAAPATDEASILIHSIIHD